MGVDNNTVAHDVCVRPARPADLAQLHAVDEGVFGELAYPYFTLRQLFDTFPDCWLVAAHPTGLVGYSLGVPSTDHTYAWLFGLAVDPRHRNLGYGRRLTQESLTLLGAMRVETVYLTVEPTNTPAIRLYRSFGFTETGQGSDYLGPGEDRVIMTRRLRCRSRADGREAVIPSPRPDLRTTAWDH